MRANVTIRLRGFYRWGVDVGLTALPRVPSLAAFGPMIVIWSEVVCCLAGRRACIAELAWLLH